MNHQVLFTLSSHIEIQGDQVFDLLEWDKNHATYRVVGFKAPIITIVDYRREIIQKLSESLKRNNLAPFAYEFSSTAQLEVAETETGNLHIKLFPSQDKMPKHMLWIAIGIDDAIPVYSYLIREVQPINESKYALFSLYERPGTHQNDHSESVPSFLNR